MRTSVPTGTGLEPPPRTFFGFWKESAILNAKSKTPKRPRDFSQAGKMVVDIATGQVEDRPPTPEEQGKNPAAVELGRKGGIARAERLTQKDRSEIARGAANRRWSRERNGRE